MAAFQTCWYWQFSSPPALFIGRWDAAAYPGCRMIEPCGYAACIPELADEVLERQCRPYWGYLNPRNENLYILHQSIQQHPPIS